MNKKIMNKKIIYSAGIAFLILFLYLTKEIEMKSIEDLEIISTVGYDIIKSSKDIIKFSAPLEVYVFKENELDTKVLTGQGITIPQVRQDRQISSDKKYLLGLEKSYIVSEDYANFGVNNIIDVLLNNPQINDTGEIVVCKGKAEDLLKKEIKGYIGSGIFIDGLIRNSNEYNFLGDNYTLIDQYRTIDAEGKNMVLPYVVKDKDEIMIAGLAIFKGYEMQAKTSLEEARYLSVLRLDKSKGIFTLYKDSKHNIDISSNVKRKVKCKIQNNKFNFTINLDIKGNIVSNQLYPEINESLKDEEELEKYLEKEIEKNCNYFIEKMQKQYKIDCLNLGSVACAYYGRNTGVDWNEIICNSNIQVKANVTIDRKGRGKY